MAEVCIQHILTLVNKLFPLRGELILRCDHDDYGDIMLQRVTIKA